MNSEYACKRQKAFLVSVERRERGERIEDVILLLVERAGTTFMSLAVFGVCMEKEGLFVCWGVNGDAFMDYYSRFDSDMRGGGE